MALNRIKYLFAVLALLSCKHAPIQVGNGGNYPESVGKIFLTKCATSGCHNNLSYSNAANLNLSSWDDLFKGANTGAVIIPFRSDFSSLCYFINTDSTQGIKLLPTMPLSTPPLTKEEYNIIVSWIHSGAPNAKGVIMFSEHTERSKIYVTNRICDVVTVIDAATLLPMRYIDVGIKSEPEFPYCIKVSPDKKHWYVSFFSNASVVQKFDAINDRFIGNLQIGDGAWTSFAITSDANYGYFVDNSEKGKIVFADIARMEVVAEYYFGGKLKYPTGIVINERLNKLYVGATYGNFLYSIDISNHLIPTLKEIPIDGNTERLYHAVLNPTQLLIDENNDNCFVACEYSKEIRVVNMKNDSVVTSIPLATNPAFMCFSKSYEWLFVSCPDDTNSFAGNRGSVKLIDANNYSMVKTFHTGYQPYGVVVNELKNIVAVANANISSKGPSSHHSSKCGSKNGNVTFIDLNTLELVPSKKIEVAVYPFGIASR